MHVKCSVLGLEQLLAVCVLSLLPKVTRTATAGRFLATASVMINGNCSWLLSIAAAWSAAVVMSLSDISTSRNPSRSSSTSRVLRCCWPLLLPVQHPTLAPAAAAAAVCHAPGSYLPSMWARGW